MKIVCKERRAGTSRFMATGSLTAVELMAEEVKICEAEVDNND